MKMVNYESTFDSTSLMIILSLLIGIPINDREKGGFHSMIYINKINYENLFHHIILQYS